MFSIDGTKVICRCVLDLHSSLSLIIPEPIQQLANGGRGAAFKFKQAVTPGVGLLGGFEGLAALFPSGDHHVAAPAAVAIALQVYPAGKRRAAITIRVQGFAALRAAEREQIRMLQAISDEGSQVNGAIGHGDGMTADAVGHVELQWNEVEAVNIFPIIEPTEDFPVVPEIKDCVEPVLIIKLAGKGLNFCKTVVRITHDYRFF